MQDSTVFIYPLFIFYIFSIVLKQKLSQFLIKWFLICKTLLYSFITLNNLWSVNCTWSEHQGDIMSTFGEGGGSARDNILSTLGSVQYFTKSVMSTLGDFIILWFSIWIEAFYQLGLPHESCNPSDVLRHDIYPHSYDISLMYWTIPRWSQGVPPQQKS